MSFANRVKNSQRATASTGWAGAAGQVLASNAVDMARVKEQSLVCDASITLVTANVNVTPSWQCSTDGTTWKTLAPMNNAAYVSITATAEKQFILDCALPFRYARMIFTSTGAGTAVNTNEFYAFSFSWLEKPFND